MSKLAKFQPWLNVEEASRLLGNLIGEEVSAEQLHDLSRQGYLPIYFRIRCDVIEITRDSDGDWRIAEEVEFQTNEILYPSSYEVVEEFVAFTATSGKGGKYIFYPEYSDSPLHFTSPEFDDYSLAFFYPEDIYLIAGYANAPGVLDWKEPITREFGVYGGSESDPWVPLTVHFPTPTDLAAPPPKQTQDSPPSYALAVFALLELLSRPSRSARNQAGIIGEILEQYPNKRGLSKRNLEMIFAAANKAGKRLP